MYGRKPWVSISLPSAAPCLLHSLVAEDDGHAVDARAGHPGSEALLEDVHPLLLPKNSQGVRYCPLLHLRVFRVLLENVKLDKGIQVT